MDYSTPNTRPFTKRPCSEPFETGRHCRAFCFRYVLCFLRRSNVSVSDLGVSTELLGRGPVMPPTGIKAFGRGAFPEALFPANAVCSLLIITRINHHRYYRQAKITVIVRSSHHGHHCHNYEDRQWLHEYARVSSLPL